MNALNQIILEGNVVKQAEKKQSSTGLSIYTFPIAVNRRYKSLSGQTVDEVSYFEVDTFGTLADKCAQWCPKGRGIRVVGRLKQNRWKDESGKMHNSVRIIAEHVEFKPSAAKKDGSPQKQNIAMLQEAAIANLEEEEVVF